MELDFRKLWREVYNVSHFVMMPSGKHLIEYFSEQQGLHLPQLGGLSELGTLVYVPSADVVHVLR